MARSEGESLPLFVTPGETDNNAFRFSGSAQVSCDLLETRGSSARGESDCPFAFG